MVKFLTQALLVLYIIVLLPIIIYNGHFIERIKDTWLTIKGVK